MTNIYNLSIARKLILSSLLYAVPIVMLLFIVNRGFDADINIARDEIAGTRYLRRLFVLYDKIPRYHALSLEAESEEKSEELNNAAEEIEKNFDSLSELQKRFAASVGMTPEDLAGRNLAHLAPEKLRKQWELFRKNGTDRQQYQAVMQNIRWVFSILCNGSKLVIDPVLDSRYLISVLTRYLPENSERIADLMFFAKEKYKASGRMLLETDDVILLKIQAELLNSFDLKRILATSHTVLKEDANHFSYSPTLHTVYVKALDRYSSATRRFLRVLERVLDSAGGVPWADFSKAGIEAHHAGYELFFVGIEELDILLKSRINSYSNVRMLGIACSLFVYLAASLLVYSIANGIRRPILSIIDYTRKISNRDFSADLTPDFGAELKALAVDIKSMVVEIKHRVGFNEGILNSIATPFIVLDQEGRITFVNKAMLRMLEYIEVPGEFIGQGVAEFFGEASAANRMIASSMRERSFQENIEVEIKGRGGRKCFVRLHASPLYDVDSRLIGVAAFLIDLTRQKIQEIEILNKNSEINRLASFTRENPNPVMACDRKGRIVYHNPATEKVFTFLPSTMNEKYFPANHQEIIELCLSNNQNRAGIEVEAEGRVFSWTYNPLVLHDIVHIYVGDITHRKQLEKQLVYDAFHDSLTGLPNRSLLIDRLEHAGERSKRNSAANFTLMYMNLDRFKLVNDSLGHINGDKLIVTVTRRIQSIIHTSDTLARMGGDEFAILFDSVSELRDAVQIAQRIHDNLKLPFQIEEYELFVTASIGIAMGTGKEASAEELLRNADTAMYRAKALGKSRYVVFNEKMHNQALSRLKLEIDLKRALEREELLLFYQPIISLADGYVSGLEALIRWQHPDRGLVMPDQFIPVAEETGLIIPMGKHILTEACRQVKGWQGLSSDNGGKLMVSVNLSVKQLNYMELINEIDKAVEKTGLSPELLKLEITESVVMGNFDSVILLMEEIKSRNIMLSIDDFGTGYSSLSYLHRYPFDTLKIDRSFISLMETSKENLEIVKTIISLSHTLKKKVVAEGVETEFQLRILRELGCEFAQGYYFSKPMEGYRVEEMLRKKPRW